MASLEIELKGQAFRGLLGAIKTLYGAPEQDRVVAALEPELRHFVSRGALVSGGWYPIAWYRELHRAAHATLRKDPQLSRKLSYEATRSDLQGIYRFVLQWVSPQTLIEQAPRIFGLYCRGAHVEVSDVREDRATVAYLECRGFDRNLWDDIIAGTTATLEQTRVRNVSGNVVGGSMAGSELRVQYHWASAEGTKTLK